MIGKEERMIRMCRGEGNICIGPTGQGGTIHAQCDRGTIISLGVSVDIAWSGEGIESVGPNSDQLILYPMSEWERGRNAELYSEGIFKSYS